MSYSPYAHDHESLWLKTSEATAFPQLLTSTAYDIVIIGAGIVGISTAHMLINSGQRVALIDGDGVLSGVTGNTTGKLTSQHGLIYHRIRDSLGDVHAQHYYEANEWAIKQVREHVLAHKVDCDFTAEDAFVVVRDEMSENALQREINALDELNIPHEVMRGFDERHGGFAMLKFPNQAHFHPRKYLLHLLKECIAGGIEIYEDSRVEDIQEHKSHCILKMQDIEIIANQVVVATHYPIHDSGLFVTKLAPYRSYAIAVKLLEPIPKGMYISHEDDPLRSTRPAFYNGEPVMIVGGGHHKVGQMHDAHRQYEMLEGWAATRYKVDSVVAQWSTQDNWTPDHRPFIGRSPHRDRIFLATGFGGWGMTTGIVAGQILSSALDGIEHEWASLYSPDRFSFEMVPKLVTENLNSAVHLVGDKIADTDHRKPEQLQPGEAAVLDSPLGRMAVHRDEEGTLHMVSAQCTHWGCQVGWNSAEKTWDCPCHGSRFACDGTVLHGPAVKPLAKPTFTPNVELKKAEL